MTVISWLFEQTPTEADPAPAFPGAVSAGDLPPEDDQNLTLEPTAESYELEPVYTIIDYTDAKGDETRRRITLRSLARGPNGPILTAICHERHAVRHFRCNRIMGFIEDTGEVIPCTVFFRDTMLIDLSCLAPTEASGDGFSEQIVDTGIVAREVRYQLNAPLIVLAAPARADNKFDPREADAIAGFALDLLGNPGGPELRAEVYKLVRLLRPDRSALTRAFRDLPVVLGDAFAIERFNHALREVAVADGRFVIEEKDFLNLLDNETSLN